MIETLTLERRLSLFSKRVEHQYFKGTVVLEVGRTNLEFEAIINQCFGTDSIIEGQEAERFLDKKRALEIFFADELDFNRLCSDSANASALHFLKDNGPITNFSELIQTQPLTPEQMTMVEEAMMIDSVLINLYGFKGRVRVFKRRRKDFKENALGLKEPNEFAHERSFAFGNFSPDHKHEIRNIVYPVYEVRLNYRNKILSFTRHWLTGCAKNSTAIDFINYWESVSPEERLTDFVKQICTLSGTKPRFPASEKM